MRWTSHSYQCPAAALLCVLLVWGVSTTRSADDVADEVGTIVWDFGYVPQKAEVSHTFYLHNDSDAPLSVSKIKAGCSCTSTSEINEPIPAGDSAAIEVTFKSGRYKGTVTKTTKVYTDENETETFRLAIKANIVKSLEGLEPIGLEPGHLKAYLGDGHVSLTSDIVSLVNRGPRDIRAILITTSGGLEFPDFPLFITAGDRIGTPVVLKRPPATDVEWIAGTIEFVDTDTTRVTIPVQIER